MSQDCLFCKIIKGEIPCYKVYENDKIFSFLDINPINPGHTLVVPKKHFTDLLEADEEYTAEIIKVVPKIAKIIMKSLDYPAFNLGVNNGSVSGQLVSHLHFHIMPRKEGDGHKLFEGMETDQEELQRISNKIKIELNKNEEL